MEDRVLFILHVYVALCNFALVLFEYYQTIVLLYLFGYINHLLTTKWWNGIGIV